MASTWVIDGFNFLRQSKSFIVLESLNFEKAKQKLIHQLKQFSQISKEKIICVFDATGSANSHVIEEPHGNIVIIYTRGGETADEWMIEYSKKMKEAVIIISSDLEILEASKKSGSAILKSEAFDRLLFQSLHSKFNEEEDDGFDPRHGTQKKGPSHRRSKKDRKIAGKIQKWKKS